MYKVINMLTGNVVMYVTAKSLRAAQLHAARKGYYSNTHACVLV